ncbi:hypothetical protein OAO87_02785 [bacterium]|nr:hypothetical protein [bacterium]
MHAHALDTYIMLSSCSSLLGIAATDGADSAAIELAALDTMPDDVLALILCGAPNDVAALQAVCQRWKRSVHSSPVLLCCTWTLTQQALSASLERYREQITAMQSDVESAFRAKEWVRLFTVRHDFVLRIGGTSRLTGRVLNVSAEARSRLEFMRDRLDCLTGGEPRASRRPPRPPPKIPHPRVELPTALELPLSAIAYAVDAVVYSGVVVKFELLGRFFIAPEIPSPPDSNEADDPEPSLEFGLVSLDRAFLFGDLRDLEAAWRTYERGMRSRLEALVRINDQTRRIIDHIGQMEAVLCDSNRIRRAQLGEAPS